MGRVGIDFVGVGVGAVLVNDRGEVFLARRGGSARDDVGKWDLPGGGVNVGERLESAIRREFDEEHGVRVRVVRQIGVFERLSADGGGHWVSINYVVAVDDGSPVIREPEKCDAIGWFLRHELPTPLTDLTVECLALFWAS